VKPHLFQRQILQGKMPAVCLLFGEESLLIREALVLIRKKLFGNKPEDVNQEIYYGGDAEPSAVIQSASTVSIFASKLLIVVKQVDRMEERKRADFIDYMDTPSPDTYLVFTAGKADMRKKFFARLKTNWPAVRYYHPYDLRETEKWIRATLKERGFGIHPAGAQLLAEAHGRELSVLRNELEKLMLYMGQTCEICPLDVAEISGQSREFNQFEFADAVGDRDGERALRIMNRLFREGLAPILILSALIALFRRLWKGKALEKQGHRGRDILSVMNIRFQGERFLAQIGAFEEEELEMIYGWFLSIDTALKRGCSHPEMLIEMLVLRICRGKVFMPRLPDRLPF
jgi:DNA polymerase-3 subunit delta